MNAEKRKSIGETLEIVYHSLIEKGEDPYVQLVGYLSSGDPAFLPQIHGARVLMSRYGSEEIIDVLLHNYFTDSERTVNK